MLMVLWQIQNYQNEDTCEGEVETIIDPDADCFIRFTVMWLGNSLVV